MGWETDMFHRFTECIPTAAPRALSAEPRAGPSPCSKRKTHWARSTAKRLDLYCLKTCIFIGKRTEIVNYKTHGDADTGNS